jgi:uncharacterized phiE125 gp8 family phage protein
MQIQGTVTVVTAPTQEPVSLQEAKNHLRVDGNQDDALIQLCIASARIFFEKSCEISIASSELQLSLDSFPETIYLPHGPINSIIDVEYTDSNSEDQTLDDWIEDIYSSPARITPVLNGVFPETAEIINSVWVTYTTGWTPSAVPKLLKTGILFYVGHLYENREGVTTGSLNEAPLAVQSIISLFSSGVYH